MIIWITGAKGFIGQHLARYYATNGNAVFGLGYGYWKNAINESNLSAWLEGEISRFNLTRLRLLHGTPDLVVHLAGGASVSASIANPHEDFSRTIISADSSSRRKRVAADIPPATPPITTILISYSPVVILH